MIEESVGDRSEGRSVAEHDAPFGDYATRPRA